MEMSGTSDQSENAGGNIGRGNGEIDHNINGDMSVSTDDDEFFISPRKLILAAKSSETQLSVSTDRVKSRRDFFEETLLNNKKPLSENTRKILSRRSLPVDSAGLAEGVPRNVRSRASLGSRSEVLARARAAIEGRKKSREMAKARVSADIMSLGGTSLSISQSASSLKDSAGKAGIDNDDVSTSHATSTPKDGAEEVDDDSSPNDDAVMKEQVEDDAAPVNHAAADDEESSNQATGSDEKNGTHSNETAHIREKARAKGNSARLNAQARLKATLAMLAADRTSSRMTSLSTSHATPSMELHSRSEEEGKNADKNSGHGANAKTSDQAEVEHDDESPAASEIKAEDQVKVNGSEKERLAIKPAKEAELKRRENEQIEQVRIMAEQQNKEEEEARLFAEEEEAQRLEQKRLAAKAESAMQAEIGKGEGEKMEQRRLFAEQLQVEEEEARRSARARAKRLEQKRLSAEAELAKQIEIEQIEKEEAVARRLAEGKAETRRLEQVRFEAEGGLDDQAGIQRLGENKIDQRRLLVEQLQKEEEEARQWAKAKSDRLEQERLTAKAEAGIQAKAEQLRKEEEEAVLFAEVEAQRLEQKRLAAEAELAMQAEVERHDGEIIEQRRLLEEQLQVEEEEARRSMQARATKRLAQKKVQAETENATIPEFSLREAAQQAELARLEGEKLEHRRFLAKQLQKEEAEARILAQAKADRLEQERLAAEAEAAKQAELKRLREDQAERETEDAMSRDDGEITQPSTIYSPIADRLSSCSGSAPIMGKHSEASDALSLGHVDRFLYQGKTSDPHQDYSDDEVFEGIATTESDSQHSEDAAEAPDDSNTEFSPIEMPNDDDTDFSPGPMWKKAAEEAEYNTMLKSDFLPREVPVLTNSVEPSPSTTHNESTLTSKGTGLRETLSQVLQELPSRSNKEYNEEPRDAWLKEPDSEGQNEEEAEVGLKEWKGFKWNRMLYMLLFGIQAGFLPSIYAQQTCHFITGDVAVGGDDAEFALYFGLQKFEPIDSAFQGSSYCQKYASDLNYKPPTLPRVASVAATIFGTISLIVIGVYLRFSMTSRTLWNGSMWMLYMGFVCQISTLSIFVLDMCQEDIECNMGPGAWMSAISAIVWFVLSVEMKMNSPLYLPVKSSESAILIEKESFTSKIKKSWQRITGEDPGLKAPSLSRTAMKKQKQRVGTVTETEMSRYRPPEIV